MLSWKGKVQAGVIWTPCQVCDSRGWARASFQRGPEKHARVRLWSLEGSSEGPVTGTPAIWVSVSMMWVSVLRLINIFLVYMGPMILKVVIYQYSFKTHKLFFQSGIPWMTLTILSMASCHTLLSSLFLQNLPVDVESLARSLGYDTNSDGKHMSSNKS